MAASNGTAQRGGGSPVPDEALRRMLEIMVLAQTCDERLRKGIATGEFMTVYWPARGQEGVPAGFATALRPDDRVVTTYRGLHDQIAKGVPLVEILGEMLGRSVGACRGKGGTMHIANPEVGLMLSTGIVGAGIPVGVGLALAARRQQSDRVVLVSFGDGATNTGSFHEAVNLAATWKLPLILVCQNNRYAEMTPTAATMPVASVADRAKGYDMPGESVDGNDPEAVHQATWRAVQRARAGEGPTLIEGRTYRFYGHFFGDQMAYIPEGELESAMAADPVTRFAEGLVERGVVDRGGVEGIEADASRQVEEAVRTALASPAPELDEMERDVYAEVGR